MTVWAHRNHNIGVELASLAETSRWPTGTPATLAVARSISSHLPPRSTPLRVGVEDVGNTDPTAALAALSEP